MTRPTGIQKVTFLEPLASLSLYRVLIFRYISKVSVSLHLARGMKEPGKFRI